MDLNKGGRGAIERMVEAYGFSTRQALCEQLGVSKSTLATRYMRDSFPSDWVIQCALETGASLKWLTTGEGLMHESAKQLDIVQVQRQKLVDGKLFDSNFYMFDKAFLPDGLIDPVVILDGNNIYIAERQFEEIIDGTWVVDIEGKMSVRDIIRIPGGKVRVEGGKFAFDCKLEDIGFIQKIQMSCTK